MHTLSICLILVTGALFASAADSNPVFKNWQECFRFMGSERGDPVIDDDFLFALAAESSMEWFPLEENSQRTVIVIRLDKLNGRYSAIRGAEGNGPFFLFSPLEHGFEYLGRMEGNSYRWGTFNGRSRFITHIHMAAREAYENTYDWNGTKFLETSHILYEYDVQGNKAEKK